MHRGPSFEPSNPGHQISSETHQDRKISPAPSSVKAEMQLGRQDQWRTLSGIKHELPATPSFPEKFHSLGSLLATSLNGAFCIWDVFFLLDWLVSGSTWEKIFLELVLNILFRKKAASGL